LTEIKRTSSFHRRPISLTVIAVPGCTVLAF
jgi:hypothetical protein